MKTKISSNHIIKNQQLTNLLLHFGKKKDWSVDLMRISSEQTNIYVYVSSNVLLLIN